MQSHHRTQTEYLALDVANSLQSYFDIKLKQAQTDNLNAAKDVAVQDAVYRAAQTAAIVTGKQIGRAHV